jgi:hypothetical protein
VPIVLHEALAHGEASGQGLRDFQLEADQARGIARIAEDVGLAALQIARPAQLALPS